MGFMRPKNKIIEIFEEFLRKFPRHFAALLLLLVAEGIVAASSILAIIPFADFLLDTKLDNPSRVTSVALIILGAIGLPVNYWVFGIIFVSLNLVNAIFKVLIRYAILKIKYTILGELISDALKTFFNSRWEFFSGSDNGKILNTLNKELSVIGDTLGHIATQFSQIIQLCIYLSVPLWLNAPLTVSALILAILFALPFLGLNRLSYRLGKKTTETANVVMGVLSEILQSARIILGFGKQTGARLRYLDAYYNHMDVAIKSQTLAVAVACFFTPLGILAAVIALGISVEQQGSISELAAVMWSLLSALPIISSLLRTNVSISNFIPSYEQLVSLRSSANKYRDIQGAKLFDKIENGIEFRDVSFSYPSRNNAITNLSLFIEKGGMTALVGESGSGKSTVTDLLIGLQVPSSGDVFIDSIPASDYNLNSFRQKIGYVPQEPILFHASIRDNLLWSYEAATEKEMWDSLRIANAEQFIKSLPDSMDTIVGDRGVRLSGGQRQRIALARALLRKPVLLILDEATSSLDTESEQLIQRSVEGLSNSMTVLIVAHRLSTIRKASQIYVMKDGIIIEEGSFSSLSERPGTLFYSMLNNQKSK